MQIWIGKKNPKIPSKMDFGSYLGGVWDGLGGLLGALGCLLAAFWTFTIELFSRIGPRWAPRSLLDRFGLDFGRVLGRFWMRFESFWAGSGQILGAICKIIVSQQKQQENKENKRELYYLGSMFGWFVHRLLIECWSMFDGFGIDLLIGFWSFF